MDKFSIRRVLGLFVRTDNLSCVAGNARLFHHRGPTIFTYHNEAGSSEWALRRVWYFYLFAIVHIGEGKSTSLPGWHLIFGKISFSRSLHEFSIRLRSADRYASVTQPFFKRKIIEKVRRFV